MHHKQAFQEGKHYFLSDIKVKVLCLLRRALIFGRMWRFCAFWRVFPVYTALPVFLNTSSRDLS